MSSLAGDESRPGVLAYAAKGDLAIIRQDNGKNKDIYGTVYISLGEKGGL